MPRLRCPVCGATSQAEDPIGDSQHYDCPRCGKYEIAGSAVAAKQAQVGFGEDAIGRIAGWVRSQNRLGQVPLIRDQDVGELLQMARPTIGERADTLLIEYVRSSAKLNGFIPQGDEDNLKWGAVAYTADAGEYAYLRDFLVQRGHVKSDASMRWRITPKGHEHVENLFRIGADSTQGFVAMWFHDSMLPAFVDGLARGIANAGYRPHRVDGREHTDRIDDEIIRQIRRSRFVVADFTGHRGGVYFEAGFALGLGLPVIWACRADAMTDLHFDIRQYNVINWTDPADLCTRLERRITAILGQGPIKTSE